MCCMYCTLFFDCKVDNGGLGGDFRSVVRIAQFGCDVEFEVRVVLDFFVSKLDQVLPTLNQGQCTSDIKCSCKMNTIEQKDDVGSRTGSLPFLTIDLLRIGPREGSRSSWTFCSSTGDPN